MEIFKFRNLALACFGFMITLFVSYELNYHILLALAIILPCLIACDLILCFVPKVKRVKKHIISYTPLCLFVFIAILVSLFVFKKDMDKAVKICDNTEKTSQIEITEINYAQEGMGIYLATVYSVDGDGLNLPAIVFLNDSGLSVGECYEVTGVFTMLENSAMGFSEKDAYLEDGILFSLDCTSYTYLYTKESSFLTSIPQSVNSFLDNIYKEHTNTTTYSILSAFFLGNRENLDDSITRDFSRIGITHVLSISGMHLVLLIGVLEFLLNKTKLSKLSKYLVLTFLVIFYILITGCDPACLRAGLMVLLTYTLEFIFVPLTKITSLFISVFLICLFNPYSVFSTSLQLSFLAMLGCFIASRYIFNGSIKKLKGKGLRYVIFTTITTLFVTFYTLPIIHTRFGMIALLSPISNIILGPLFSLIIYIAPLVLLLCSIPFLGAGVVFVAERLTDLSLFLTSSLSSIERTVVPMKNALQAFGTVVITLSVLLLLFVSRKRIKFLIASSVLGTLILFAGSTYLYVERGSTSYVGTYSYSGNDFVFYESENQLSVIDVTNGRLSGASLTQNLVSYLGYSELNNYIMTTYSQDRPFFFNRLCNRVKVINAYIAFPKTDEELAIYCQLIEIAKSEGVNLVALEKDFSLSDAKVHIEANDRFPSVKEGVCIQLVENNSYFTYIGSGCYDGLNLFAYESAALSDILVLGDYGPPYTKLYDYETPYLDYCVFLGSSSEYASTDFIIKVADKTVLFEKTPIRFRLP